MERFCADLLEAARSVTCHQKTKLLCCIHRSTRKSLALYSSFTSVDGTVLQSTPSVLMSHEDNLRDSIDSHGRL
jgi:hypothetical protein